MCANWRTLEIRANPARGEMIRYTTGNLLDAQSEALVNTVNEMGVMGKGIALMFREAFPANTATYEAACKKGEVRVGRMAASRLTASQPARRKLPHTIKVQPRL